MMTEFVGLQLSRSELQEVHISLLKQAILEDELRRERGLEDVDHHPLLERIEGVLGLDQQASHMLDHVAEDELWEYSWYAYTDEWAWYRAEQDTRAAAGETPLSEADLLKGVESRYRKNFNAYVAEIAMKEIDPKPRGTKTPQMRRG